MKIAYFYTDDWEKEYAGTCPLKNCVACFPGLINDYQQLDRTIEAIVVFVDSRVTAAVLEALPNLKLIVTRSTGFNHIDLAAARKRGVVVCNVPAYATHAVAEFTWALLLNLLRHINEAYARIKNGSLLRYGLMGPEVYGKTLGVVGFGNIGSQVARIARGFGMDVLAYDIRADQELAKQLGVMLVPFEQLLERSDIISLHVTYHEQTHHMINHETLKKIKRGAYLINTARGEVVQTEALVAGLDSGVLAGVALDVVEEEFLLAHETQAVLGNHTAETLRRLVANHYLLNHPRVLMTPHNAFNSVESRERCLGITIQNIQAWLAGKPVNVVC